MIDVHSHYLPLVDDGSPSAELSIKKLKEAEALGVTAVILTPHYRKNYRAGKKELLPAFEDFSALCEKEGLGVSLYLGQEVYYEKGAFDDIENAPYATLCGGKNLLVELPFGVEIAAYDVALTIINQGYIPVFAHVERYPYLTPRYLAEIKELGALVQVNAGSIVGFGRKVYGKTVKKLIKQDLVDLVASDCHFNRENDMGGAYELIKKKCGEEYAARLFYENPKRIIDGK